METIKNFKESGRYGVAKRDMSLVTKTNVSLRIVSALVGSVLAIGGFLSGHLEAVPIGALLLHSALSGAKTGTLWERPE